MRKWKSREDLIYHALPTHYHYQYHYHYPITHPQHFQDPQATHLNDTYQAPSQTKQVTVQQEKSFFSQQNEWKRYLNPKVSRMYEEYQLRESRFSQKNARIDKLLEPQEIELPRRSAVLLDIKQRSSSGTQKRQLKKLEQLYNIQRKLKNNLQQKNRSEITMLTSSENIDVQSRLNQLQKQIQRLRMIEQECIYLRDKFYLHIVSRHGNK